MQAGGGGAYPIINENHSQFIITAGNTTIHSSGGGSGAMEMKHPRKTRPGFAGMRAGWTAGKEGDEGDAAGGDAAAPS
jgi:hypothetical protein